MRNFLIAAGATVATYLILGTSWHKTALIPGRPGPGARDGWECGTFLQPEDLPSYYTNSPQNECNRMLSTLQSQVIFIALAVGVVTLILVRKYQAENQGRKPSSSRQIY